MKLFDKIKKELVGKYAYSKGGIKFKIEGVMYGYQNINEKVSDYWSEELKKINFQYMIGGVLLYGADENGNSQELLLNEINLIEFKPLRK